MATTSNNNASAAPLVRNPLRRDGTSQKQRFPQALEDDFVKIDERKMEDFLVFANRFSRLINFYDSDNTLNGTWKEFFESDLSMIIALISKFDSTPYRTAYDTEANTLETNIDNWESGTTYNTSNFDPYLLAMFELPVGKNLTDPEDLSLIRQIDAWYRQLVDGSDMKEAVRNIIVTDMGPALSELMKIESDLHAVRTDYTNAEFKEKYRGLDAIWGLADFTADTPPSGTYPSAGYIYDDTDAASERKSLRKVLKVAGYHFNTLYHGLRHLSEVAPGFMQDSLENYQYHEPHMALYIAFIKLFQHAQNHLNTLTNRHLEFYYKEVLQLAAKGETPDQAHLLFELHKGVTEYLMPAGTQFEGGKDDSGVKLIYESNQDVMLNRGTIDEVKSVFVQRGGAQNRVQGIYASPEANSADGKGDPILDEADGWAALGETQENLPAIDRTMPDAELGFSLASPLLLLSEGERTIRLGLLTSQITSSRNKRRIARMEVELKNNLNVQLSGAEGWLDVAIDEVVVFNTISKANDADYADLVEGIEDLPTKLATHDLILLKVVLTGSQPAVVGFDKSVLDGDFDTTHPVVKVSFNNEGRLFKGSSEALGNRRLFNFGVGRGSIVYSSVPSVFAQEIDSLSFFPIPTFFDPPKYYVERGNIYRREKLAVNDHKFDSIADFIDERFPNSYDETVTYPAQKAIVQHNGALYAVDKASVSPAPYEGSEFWQVQHNYNGGLSTLPAYDPDATYYAEGHVNYQASNSLVKHLGKVYKVIKSSLSPDPETNPLFWCRLQGNTSSPIQYLDELELTELILRVDVEGVSDLVLQNDQGRVDPSQAFLPFTSTPVPGSNFYIGSNEVFQKQIDKLDIDIDWGNLPSVPMASHYSAYGSGSQFVENKSFQAKVSFLEDRKWTTVPDGGEDNRGRYALFNGRESVSTTTGAPPPECRISPNLDIQTSRYPGLQDFDAFSVSQPRGFVRLELQRAAGMSREWAFGHAQYNPIYTKAVIEATALANGNKSTETTPPVCPAPKFTVLSGTNNGFDFTREVEYDSCIGEIASDTTNVAMPKFPYTPKINRISLNYSSGQVIAVSDSGRKAYTDRVEKFYHLHPFGRLEQHGYTLEGEETLTLVPHHENEGYLYLGLNNVNPPENLSVFVQLAEGSGDPEVQSPQVVWSVLIQDRWQDLEPVQVISDSTKGLLNSGVIVFNLSKFATNENKVMPKGLYWLRATAAAGTKALDRVIKLATQAVTVSYKNNGNSPNHLKNALPAYSIAKFVNKNGYVKGVEQPYSSFGGRIAEQDREFKTRISERLRHKQRAITIFDYERLVLEQFPEIYKAKCLNHTSLITKKNGKEEYCEIAPGHVLMIAIPDLRNKNAINPLEPRTSLGKLQEVREFLLEHMSSFVELKVRNPLYERIRVSCDVGFHTGKDSRYYAEKLNEDLKRFLSPWAFDEGEDIVFGGRIHQSVILNYIEERPYVDYVLNFQLYHGLPGSMIPELVEEAVTTTSRSILVSDSDHLINPIEATEFECASSDHFSGVDFWIVEGDFIVQP